MDRTNLGMIDENIISANHRKNFFHVLLESFGNRSQEEES